MSKKKKNKKKNKNTYTVNLSKRKTHKEIRAEQKGFDTYGVPLDLKPDYIVSKDSGYVIRREV